MNESLKPCPFCGAIPEIVEKDVEPQGDPRYGEKVERFVECQCGVCLFDEVFHEGFVSDEEAIKIWNRRNHEYEHPEQKIDD